jgi:hypothetical protein
MAKKKVSSTKGTPMKPLAPVIKSMDQSINIIKKTIYKGK